MEILVNGRSTDWVIIISILASTFLVLANFVNAPRTKQLLIILFSAGGNELALSFNQDKRSLRTDALMLISAVSALPLAIIATKLLSGTSLSAFFLFGWAEYFRMVLLTTVFLVVKSFLASIIGWVFNLQEELIAAQNIFLAHFNWVALSTALLSLLVYFGPWPVFSAWLLIVVLVLGLLVAIFKTSVFTFRIGIPSTYFILYLCALEIIPISYLLFLV
ncbi:MAG: hypothetical protein DA405_03915 [Bacteroidetes bacterium]|nr:MAG: hypothetical protein DA405_03915 [Bacteroidota bacterium]